MSASALKDVLVTGVRSVTCTATWGPQRPENASCFALDVGAQSGLATGAGASAKAVSASLRFTWVIPKCAAVMIKQSDMYGSAAAMPLNERTAAAAACLHPESRLPIPQATEQWWGAVWVLRVKGPHAQLLLQ